MTAMGIPANAKQLARPRPRRRRTPHGSGGGLGPRHQPGHRDLPETRGGSADIRGAAGFSDCDIQSADGRRRCGGGSLCPVRPSRDQTTAQVTEQVGGQVTAQVLQFCQTPRKASEIRELLNLRQRETFTENYLRPLLEKGWLEPTIPDKPRSRMQRYRTTEAGLAMATAHASGRPPDSGPLAPDTGRKGGPYGTKKDRVRQ